MTIKKRLALSNVLMILVPVVIVLAIFFMDRFLIRFVFRRIEDPLITLAEGVHAIGDISIDTSSHRVTVKGREIRLKNKEYELLLFMVYHMDQVFDKETLYENVWGMCMAAADSVPGISGSTILLIFGLYVPVIDAVKNTMHWIIKNPARIDAFFQNSYEEMLWARKRHLKLC